MVSPSLTIQQNLSDSTWFLQYVINIEMKLNCILICCWIYFWNESNRQQMEYGIIIFTSNKKKPFPAEVKKD